MLPCEGGEALAQIVQGNCPDRCSIPGNVQGQVGRGLQQPGAVGGVPATAGVTLGGLGGPFEAKPLHDSERGGRREIPRVRAAREGGSVSAIGGAQEGPRRVSVPVIATTATKATKATKATTATTATKATAPAALSPGRPAPRGALWEAEGTMADGEEPEKKRRRLEELLADGMAVDGGCGDSGDWEGRWNHVKKFLERSGPFTHPDFEPGTQALDFLLSTCKVLVIGAGGLGCELLKNLALSGFRQIHVIDMDTIDVSNLNRQFLFRPKDVGRPKAEVAAEFLNSRIPNCAVVPYFKKIQDMDESFYRQFHIIVCGLDSIIARRWINGMLMSFLHYEDGVLDPSSIIPLIDGGTEGFKGNVRVIIPGMTACVECTLALYPPQVNFPMCTIASMPRLPEHCIEYVRILQWPKEQPFGEGIALDGDDPEHIQWIYQKSLERASQFNIKGVTYRLTQGVVKRIIPAVASTNAVIAAVCATEVFKIATSAYVPLNNYLVFNDVDGLYTYSFEAERKENCPACSQLPQNIEISPSAKLQEILDYLTNNASLQMKSPAITATMYGGNKTLYLQTVASIEERTRPNLSKTLKELGLVDGQELAVADVTTPQTMLFKLHFTT